MRFLTFEFRKLKQFYPTAGSIQQPGCSGGQLALLVAGAHFLTSGSLSIRASVARATLYISVILDLAPVEQRELRAQQALILGEQLQRERLVALRERAVAHHVREHDGGQLALPGVLGWHECIKPESGEKETKDRQR